jgi:hypothetical protein
MDAIRRAFGHGQRHGLQCHEAARESIKSVAWIAHLDLCRKVQATPPGGEAACLDDTKDAGAGASATAVPAIFSRFHKSCVTRAADVRLGWYTSSPWWGTCGILMPTANACSEVWPPLV